MVQALLAAAVLAGLGSLAWAAKCFTDQQPYGDWLLLGVLLTLIAGANFRVIQKLYQAEELRRIQALDR